MAGVWSIVVAGGTGLRFGQRKQFALLGGRPVVEWSVQTAKSCSDGVVLVLPADDTGNTFGADVVVAGGASRSESVRCGLAALPSMADIVVVHDAARPLASPSLFTAVLAALSDDGVDAAICAIRVSDTLKRTDAVLGESPTAPEVLETLDREALIAVQTPQAFRADVLRKAHENAKDATDDAALVEQLGVRVRVVAGDPHNIKITTPSDLAYAEFLKGD